MLRDRLGRSRQPGQTRGLRPLHPRLPARWTSRVVRLAMSEADWAQFDSLMQQYRRDGEPLAHSYGRAVAALVHLRQPPASQDSPLDWLDWERLKSQRLLPRSR